MDTLLLIATNVMLLTEPLPRADEILDNLSKEKNDWAAWKKLHKADYWKAKVKKQTVGGQDQFGAAHSTIRQMPQV